MSCMAGAHACARDRRQRRARPHARPPAVCVDGIAGSPPPSQEQRHRQQQGRNRSRTPSSAGSLRRTSLNFALSVATCPPSRWTRSRELSSTRLAGYCRAGLCTRRTTLPRGEVPPRPSRTPAHFSGDSACDSPNIGGCLHSLRSPRQAPAAAVYRTHAEKVQPQTHPGPFSTQEQPTCGDNFHSNIRPQRRRARILALRAPPPRPSAARARRARPFNDRRRRQRRRRCWCRRRYP